MCAIPSASEGAPPVRENSVCSPTLWASAAISPAVTGKPQLEMVATAAAGVAPTIPAGELTAKYTPGCKTHAAIIAMMATKLSSSMDPYPTGQACDSLPIIFGVVPEEISEWNPEMAPHAMVMKQNGKILPAKIGPVPSVNRVNALRCPSRTLHVSHGRFSDTFPSCYAVDNGAGPPAIHISALFRRDRNRAPDTGVLGRIGRAEPPSARRAAWSQRVPGEPGTGHPPGCADRRKSLRQRHICSARHRTGPAGRRGHPPAGPAATRRVRTSVTFP